MNYLHYLVLLIIVTSNINISHGLECYVCTNQEDNVEKCLNTIKTCEQDEDGQLNNITYPSGVLLKTNAKECVALTCLFALIFGMKIGNVRNVVKETVATIISFLAVQEYTLELLLR
ncbi:coiled [Carabus blaptoides fortunei]